VTIDGSAFAARTGLADDDLYIPAKHRQHAYEPIDGQPGQVSTKDSRGIKSRHLEATSNRGDTEVPPPDDSLNPNEKISLREFQLRFRKAEIRKDIA
jgi:hypothetical protein